MKITRRFVNVTPLRYVHRRQQSRGCMGLANCGGSPVATNRLWRARARFGKRARVCSTVRAPQNVPFPGCPSVRPSPKVPQLVNFVLGGLKLLPFCLSSSNGEALSWHESLLLAGWRASEGKIFLMICPRCILLYVRACWQRLRLAMARPGWLSLSVYCLGNFRPRTSCVCVCSR